MGKKIEEIEVGKTYKLIDKEGFIAADEDNITIVPLLEEDDTFVVEEIGKLGGAQIKDCVIMYFDEREFFEEVEVPSEDDINPLIEPPGDIESEGVVFGELSRDSVEYLIHKYLGSVILQEKVLEGDNPDHEGHSWIDMDFNDRLCFDNGCLYRVKPPRESKKGLKI